MLIRKLFKFESAHILDNCPSLKCKEGLHGHSYKLELIISSESLTDYMMVCDFSQVSYIVSHFISLFDHSVILYSKSKNQNLLKKSSKKWVSIPFNTTAEAISIFFFMLIEKAFKLSNLNLPLKIYSIKLHETDSGYVECFSKDITPYVDFLDKIEFSNYSLREFKDLDFMNKFNKNIEIKIPKEL